MFFSRTYLNQVTNIVLILSSGWGSLESVLLLLISLWHSLIILLLLLLLKHLFLQFLLIIECCIHFLRFFIIYYSFLVVHLLHSCKWFILVNFLFSHCHIILINSFLVLLLVLCWQWMTSLTWLFYIVICNIVCSTKPVWSCLAYPCSQSLWPLTSMSRVSHNFSFLNLLIYIRWHLLLIVVLLLIKRRHSELLMSQSSLLITICWFAITSSLDWNIFIHLVKRGYNSVISFTLYRRN